MNSDENKRKKSQEENVMKFLLSQHKKFFHWSL